MKSARIRIDGIYDKRTLASIFNHQVIDYQFDLRPRSFNFIQEHKLLDIIMNVDNLLLGRPSFRYFLHFAGEQDYVITKLASDVKKVIKQNDAIILEFSDAKEVDFYDSFGTPYFCHYHPLMKLGSFLASPYFSGLVVPYSHLEGLHEQGMFHNFVKNLLQVSFGALESGKMELVLALDWDSNVFPSIYDFLDFSLVSLPINNKVEVCYRNVDLGGVETGLRHLQSLSQR